MTVYCVSGLIGVSTLYFCLHFGIYVFALRTLSASRSERFILLYHLVAAVVFSTLVLVAATACTEPSALTTAVGLVFAHGIYSMSFLELWSLAQGSYSITLLLRVMRGGSVPTSQLREELAAIGERKKRNRIAALAGLGLLGRHGDELKLTAPGRLVSQGLKCLLWITNPGETG